MLRSPSNTQQQRKAEAKRSKPTQYRSEQRAQCSNMDKRAKYIVVHDVCNNVFYAYPNSKVKYGNDKARNGIRIHFRTQSVKKQQRQILKKPMTLLLF